MTARYFDLPAAACPEDHAADRERLEAMVTTASRLTLRGLERRGDSRLAGEVRGQMNLLARLRVYMKRPLPTKGRIAATYAVAEDSLQVYLWYPVKWWHLATVRLPEYLRHRRDGQADDEIHAVGQLERWLREEG